jgi:streptogramin lyase
MTDQKCRFDFVDAVFRSTSAFLRRARGSPGSSGSPGSLGSHVGSKVIRLSLAALAATTAWAPGVASAAVISQVEFSLGGSDSLAYAMGSLVASTWSTRLLRYQPDAALISKMTFDVEPNTNLVGLGATIWFTTRGAPYRIGRADLATVTGVPAYYGPDGMPAPYDDMALGIDNSVCATNAASGRIVRVSQAGSVTVYGGTAGSASRIAPVGIAKAADGGMWFADRANRSITRIDPLTGTFTDYAIPQTAGPAIPERVVVAASGLVWFATQTGFGHVDAAKGVVEHVSTGPQSPKRLAAARDGSLWLTDGTASITQFTPPATMAKLPVFPETDARAAGLYIDASGVVYASDPQWWRLARIATAADTPADATIVEFHNAAIDHYFVTADRTEAAAIDAGSAGPGWARTGETWNTWTKGPIPDATQVCRFYGSAAIDATTGARRGPNSHFYTVQPGECASVKLDDGWTYEAAGSFWMLKPTGAACPPGSQPVYRAYNNRYAQNDSNHRYMVNPAVYATMIASGWTGEGIVMCAPG